MNDTLKAALKGAAIGLPVSIVASLLAQYGVNTAVLKNSQPGELKINVPKFGTAALGTAAGAALGAGAQQAKFVKDAVVEKSINKNRLLNAQRQVLRENGLLQNVEKPIMAGKKDYDYVVNHNPRPYQLRPYQPRPYQPARNRDELLKIDTVKDVTPNYPITEPEKSRQFSIVGGGLKLISAGVSGLGNLVGIADAAGKGAKVVQKVGQALSNNVSDSINIKNPILKSVANGAGTTIKYQLVKPAVTKASSYPLLSRQSSGFSETIIPNSMLSDLDSAQIACISNDANLEDSVGARKDLINDRLDSLLIPATLKLNQATTLQSFSEGDFNFVTDIGKSIWKGVKKFGVGLGIGKDKFGQDIKDSLSKGVDNASKSLSDNLTNLGEKAREARNKVLESSRNSATPGSDAAKAIETKISDNISNRNVFEKTADIAKVGSELAKSAVKSIPNKTVTKVALDANKILNNKVKTAQANADEAQARARNAQAGLS